MKRNRLVIYPKDIQLITGRSETYARRIVRTIKKSLGKQKHQLVTCDEYCGFTGLSRAELEEYLH